MITAWTKHLKDPEEKDRFEKSIRNSKWILERLDEIILEMKDDLDSHETSTKQYENRNWAYRQADSNGFRRCLKAIRKVINLDHKDEIRNNDRQSTS